MMSFAALFNRKGNHKNSQKKKKSEIKVNEKMNLSAEEPKNDTVATEECKVANENVPPSSEITSISEAAAEKLNVEIWKDVNTELKQTDSVGARLEKGKINNDITDVDIAINEAFAVGSDSKQNCSRVPPRSEANDSLGVHVNCSTTTDGQISAEKEIKEASKKMHEHSVETMTNNLNINQTECSTSSSNDNDEGCGKECSLLKSNLKDVSKADNYSEKETVEKDFSDVNIITKENVTSGETDLPLEGQGRCIAMETCLNENHIEDKGNEHLKEVLKPEKDPENHELILKSDISEDSTGGVKTSESLKFGISGNSIEAKVNVIVEGNESSSTPAAITSSDDSGDAQNLPNNIDKIITGESLNSQILNVEVNENDTKSIIQENQKNEINTKLKCQPADIARTTDESDKETEKGSCFQEEQEISVPSEGKENKDGVSKVPQFDDTSHVTSSDKCHSSVDEEGDLFEDAMEDQDGNDSTITGKEKAEAKGSVDENQEDLLLSVDNPSPFSSNPHPSSEIKESVMNDSVLPNNDDLSGGKSITSPEAHIKPSWKVGYLQVKLPNKSRSRGKFKVWHQRWVVVHLDEFVKDTSDPSLMINVYLSESGTSRKHSALFWQAVAAHHAVVYRSHSRTHKYAFSISVGNDVVLHLAANSETETQEWMMTVRNLLWPPNPVLQLEKVLNGNEFEISIIDNEFSYHAGLLGAYGFLSVTSRKLILVHPQTGHVIQEWYLNTIDKFQLSPEIKQEDLFKIVIMHTGSDSSTGSGQIKFYCQDAVVLLQSVASTIHNVLSLSANAEKEDHREELAELAAWLTPTESVTPPTGETEDYYKVPRRLVRSLLDIPNFLFDKPISCENCIPEVPTKNPSLASSSTWVSTYSQDSGISSIEPADDFLNCSLTSFTIGGRKVLELSSSDSSDAYSPPCSPEIERKSKKGVEA